CYVSHRTLHSFPTRRSSDLHDFDALAATILADLHDVNPGSFRVSARRADKRLPFTSPEIEREVGGRIKEAKGWHVDLGHPELTIDRKSTRLNSSHVKISYAV